MNKLLVEAAVWGASATVTFRQFLYALESRGPSWAEWVLWGASAALSLRQAYSVVDSYDPAWSRKVE